MKWKQSAEATQRARLEKKCVKSKLRDNFDDAIPKWREYKESTRWGYEGKILWSSSLFHIYLEIENPIH